MAQASPIINSFVAGELSPRLAGRTDIQQYYQSAAEIRNMLVEFYGGAKKAPGTYFVNEVKDSSLSTRLFRFVFSDTQAYILEFGNLYIRFYKDDATTGKGGAILETGKDISGIVLATGVITATSHGFSDGDTVYISGIVGTTELNGKRYLIDNASTHTFTLTDIDGVAIDTTGFTAWSSAGTAARVYTLTTTYTTADLWKLEFAQTADILYITLGKSDDAAKGRPQKKLTRTAHTSWTITDIDYSTGEARPALMAENLTTTTITPSAATGDGITLTASVAIFDITHEGSIWKVNTGYVKITDVASGGLKTTATANVLYSGTLTGTSAYTVWSEGAWSGYRGYPRAVTISEGRLHYGYTVSQPTTDWGSSIGAYDTFELGSDDADATEFDADTNQVEIINWLFPANEILVGTPSGVSALGTGSDTLAFTATTGRMKKKIRNGASSIPPQAIGNNVFYWQKYNRILREYGIDVDTLDYDAKDATAISEHISESGIVDMDYQQSPHSILWCVRSDGKLAALTRQIEQKVTAWTLHDTNGYYESVAVIPKESYDEVWFIVRRTIEGVTRRYIEYMVAPEFDEQEDIFLAHSGLMLDDPKTITNITKTDPVVVTCSNDFSNGDIVKIRGLVAREAGVIPEKTVDAMEYSTDALAQAAYVSSDTGTEGELVSEDTNDANSALGDTADVEYRPGQSFQLTADTVITAISVRFGASTGTPAGDVTIKIETDDSNKPSGNLVHANASKTFTPTASSVNKVTFDDSFTVSASTKYWVRLYCDNQATNDRWSICRSDTDVYSSGGFGFFAGGVWNGTYLSSFDMCFKVHGILNNLQCYVEATIKDQGLYSLKGVALITDSLNDTLTRTISVPINLTGVETIVFSIRSTRTGSNIKIGIHDSGGTTTEITPNITVANTWQDVSWDISAVTNANKDAIDSIIITIMNADAENTFYIDGILTSEVVAATVGMAELNNNRYVVAAASGTDFELRDLYGNNIDGTAFTAYDTGGEVRKCVNEVSGLDHLASENVQVFTDGEYHPDRTVTTDGVVTLDGYYAQIIIGLGYTARLKSNDLEASPGGVTSQGKTKRVSAASVNIYKSLDYKIGTDAKMDSVTVRAVSLAADTVTPLFTGIKNIPFPSGWDNKKQIIIEQEKCLPLHVLSIVAEMESN